MPKPAMSLFDAIPIECIVYILSNCGDFPQLFLLISTCRRLHQAWTTNPGSIIWDIGTRNVICFNDALMAVRATNVVKAAFDAGEPPPDPFQIGELSGIHQKPSIQELHGALALRHMMHFVKHNIVDWEVSRLTQCGATEQELVDETALLSCEDDKIKWDTNAYRALYRNVLIGALFSRAFTEPMFSAIEIGSPFTKSLVRRAPEMEQQHNQYLAGFPAYSPDPEQYGQVFKPLADWIVADGRARDQNDEALVGELLHVLAAYEHLRDQIVNGYGHEARNTRGYLGRRAIDYITSANPSGENNLTVTVALLGIFQLETVSLPIEVMDTTNLTSLVANPYQGRTSNFPFWPCLTNLTHSADYTSPGPMLHFFEFVLKNSLGLGFTDKAFTAWDDDQEDPQEDLPYHSITRLSIFTDGRWDHRLVEAIA